MTGPVRLAGDRSADLVSAVLLGFGLLIAVMTAYLVLRPAEPSAHLSPARRAAAAGAARPARRRDSLGYFALRRDKSRGLLRQRQGGADVPGGARGAAGHRRPARRPGGLARRDLRVAGAGPAARLGAGGDRRQRAWRDGVRTAPAWTRSSSATRRSLDVADFSLEGRTMRGVRQAVARIERAGSPRGAAASATSPPRSWPSCGSARPLARRRGRARLLDGAGRFGEPADAAAWWSPRRDADGRAARAAALRAVGRRRPVAGPDAPRPRRRQRAERADGRRRWPRPRRAGRPSGVAELRGVPLGASSGASGSAPARCCGSGARCCCSASRCWQIESLYRANAKYQPTWVPRFLCFPRARDLPRVASPRSRPRRSSSGPAPCAASSPQLTCRRPCPRRWQD